MSDLPTLVADVGGTNTRVALARRSVVDRESARKFVNSEFGGLDQVLSAFVAGSGPVGQACVAVAGPVEGDGGELTNLAWRFSADGLAKATGASEVRILNDLQAQACALGHIGAGSIRTVIDRPASGSTMLVVGAGTGFNAAVALDTPSGPVVPPAEVGHCDLAVETPEEFEVAEYLRREHGFASVEDALAGRGLPALDAWVGGTKRNGVDIMNALAAGEDRATSAARMYVRLLGRATGNLALTFLPYGGLFLIGGMARAMSPYFGAFGFEEAFMEKGRLRPLMERFPVAVIEDDFAALTGCAVFMKKRRKSDDRAAGQDS